MAREFGPKAQRIVKLLDEGKLSARRIAGQIPCSTSYVYEVKTALEARRSRQGGTPDGDAEGGATPLKSNAPEVATHTSGGPTIDSSGGRQREASRPVFPIFHGDSVGIDWSKTHEPAPDAPGDSLSSLADPEPKVFVGLQAKTFPAMVRTIVDKSESLELDSLETAALALLDDMATQVDEVAVDKPGFDLPPTAALGVVGVVSLLLLMRVTKRAKSASEPLSVQENQRGDNESSTDSQGPPTSHSGGGVLNNLLKMEPLPG